MLIGVPREIKIQEHRVGLVPENVRELVAQDHQVLVECTAGACIGVADDEYRAAGASIAADTDALWERVELVVKVKEPQPRERKRLRAGQALFTYLHLGADRAQAMDPIASGATRIAYETVTAAGDALPLLVPMSEVAGRMAVQVGAHYLEKLHGGRGVLLGGGTVGS